MMKISDLEDVGHVTSRSGVEISPQPLMSNHVRHHSRITARESHHARWLDRTRFQFNRTWDFWTVTLAHPCDAVDFHRDRTQIFGWSRRRHQWKEPRIAWSKSPCSSARPILNSIHQGNFWKRTYEKKFLPHWNREWKWNRESYSPAQNSTPREYHSILTYKEAAHRKHDSW